MPEQMNAFAAEQMLAQQGVRREKQAGRRDFLRSLGLGAASVAAGLAPGSRAVAQQQNLDIAILEFALNLEYLEAEFYLRAVTGNGLPVNLIGPSPGPVTGGGPVPFASSLVQAYAKEIADDEMKHVAFLRAAVTALSGSVIGRPALDLSTSFTTLASIAGLGSTFNAYADDTSFLLAAYVFEDVGVTAYHGAASLITNKAILDKAAGILGTEAYHAGLVRTVLFAQGAADQTQAISNVRATLDGTAGTQNIDDRGVGTTTNPSISLVSNSLNGSLAGGFPSPQPPGDNAIAYERTTRQVLNIVYGAQNATHGLFFPNGLNGIIKS